MSSKETFDVDTGTVTKSSGNRGTIAIVSIVITALIVAAITVPLTYFLHPDYGRTVECPVEPEPQLDDHMRVNCHAGWEEGTEKVCIERGCTWSVPTVDTAAPKCYFPEKYGGYRMVGTEDETPSGYRITLDRIPSTPSLFGGDINRLILDIEFHTEYRLRFKFYDPANKRYEVPLDMPVAPSTKPSKRLYHVTFTSDPFTLKITRKDSGAVLWDTSLGPLIFSDQFLQITTKLPSANLYGFGENEHPSFRHDLQWKAWGMFSRDQPPGGEGNLYGVHPYYMSLEEDNKAHGVLLLNSNAMDVAFQPTPALTYHTIGGILDFYMFLGPTPEKVVQQYTEAIGRTFMPPYWSLGFQLCRYGYNSLDRVKEVVAGIQKYDIPHDVQYGDIDYMNRQMDFTIGDSYVGLGDFVDELKANGTHYIIILDPAIAANETSGTYAPYDEGVAEDVFIKKPSGEILFGKVWPDYPGVVVDPSQEWDYQVENYRAYAVFPDFSNPSTQQWWTNQITAFHNEIKFDGIWIDMNEPANFVKGSTAGCDSNKYNNPPFQPRIYGTITDKTICMDAEEYRTASDKTTHYNKHSLYGWSQSAPTLSANEAVTGKRGMVISRSTYPGSGKYIGHWLGDNTSKWPDMHKSIIGMLEFNLFGIPYIGADICGFFQDTTIDMCRRWMQLGAFYPYARNHNGLNNIPQDPAAFGDEFATDSRNVLLIRYTLLPYLYTLFYEAHTMGSTVVRPLMHEFTSDSVTWDIDRQFLWGPAFLISPVLDQDMENVDVYIPEGPWYIYKTGHQLLRKFEQQWVEMYTPMNEINLHVRGGYILPTQQPARSTVYSRTNPFGLIVALDASEMAMGSLFWDDGESKETIASGDYYLVKYVAGNGVLQSTITNPNLSLMNGLVLDDIKVWGLRDPVSQIMYNSVVLDTGKWTFDEFNMILQISDLNHPMNENIILEIQ